MRVAPQLLIFIVISFVVSPFVWGVSVDQRAPFFVLKELRGKTRAGPEKYQGLEQYRGKVVYLDFWASWCLPCRQSFPALSSLRERYADQGFEVIAVNLDENHQHALQFLAQFPVNYPVVAGFGTEVAEQYGVEVMPTGYFIDANGVIRLIHKGFKSEHAHFLEAILQKLLAERD